MKTSSILSLDYLAVRLIFALAILICLQSNAFAQRTHGPLSGATGSTRYFSIVVPANCPLLILTSYGGTGDADIYASFNVKPTKTRYQHSSTGGTNTEAISVPYPKAGTWRVMVNGYSAYTGLMVGLSATAPVTILPAPTISPGNASTSSITATWTWGGNLAQVSSVTVSVAVPTAAGLVFGSPKSQAVAKIGSYTLTGLPHGTTYQVRVNYNAKAGYTGSSAVITMSTANPPTPTRVALLLHGLSSSGATWGELNVDLAELAGTHYAWNNCPIITPGQPTYKGRLIHGAYWFAINFGLHDETTPELTGVGGLRSYGKANGDFSTFDELGTEVKMAVSQIRNLIPDASIMLIGHSRGGLAARAFLQNYAGSPEANAVKGLVTIGTPHSGSEIGKIYDYLRSNPENGMIVKSYSATVPQTAFDGQDIGDLMIPAGFEPFWKYDTPRSIGDIGLTFGANFSGFAGPINVGSWQGGWWANPGFDQVGYLYGATYWSDQVLTIRGYPNYFSGFETNVTVATWDRATWKTVKAASVMLNARRPGVGMLAPASPEMISLNSRVSRLPSHVSYVSISFNGAKMGRVYSNGFFNAVGVDSAIELFAPLGTDTGKLNLRVSPLAQRACIGSQNPDAIPSDGIVTEVSQQLSNLQGLPSTLSVTTQAYSTQVLHLDETKQTTEIIHAINTASSNW